MTLPRWLITPIKVVWRTIRLYAAGNGLSWSGALGLYLFLSVPPLMVASAFVASFIGTEEQAREFVLSQASRFVPAEAELLESVLPEGESIATGAWLVSLAFLLFSGSRTFAALASGINRMWRLTEHLTIWKTQGLRFALLGFAFVLMALTGLAEAGITAVAGGASDDQVWLLEAQVLPFAVLGTFLFVAYRALPETTVSWRHALIGAVLATVGVRIAQAVMGVMSDAGTFDTPYGGLAGVGLMATWALVVGVAILLGATLVAVLDGVDERNDAAAD